MLQTIVEMVILKDIVPMAVKVHKLIIKEVLHIITNFILFKGVDEAPDVFIGILNVYDCNVYLY